jgi:AcrR family transcriptional regulator
MSERPLRADALRNRTQVLQAARAAFAADGVSVPLDEIARRAGVGAGTVYRHFPTKEALFEAVVHDRLTQLVDQARALRSAPDPQAALFEFIGRLVTEAAAKRDLIDALDSAGVDVTTTLAGTAAELRAEIGHLLIRAQRASTVRDDIDINDLMAILSGTVLATQRLANEQADPQRLIAILCDGLNTSPKPQASPVTSATEP